MTIFNEDSRVKIPALLHLTRLGWCYLSLKDARWDARNNIFPDIFGPALLRINQKLRPEDVQPLRDAINLDLQNLDLGRAFHKRLIARSGVRLFDFDNLDNNSFHVVTELPFENGDDNFRPDITLLVNGLPLAFIEVKKRMNPGGVLEERARMNRRHANPKFRHFFNLVQLMVFSNNMEYDDGQFEPVQGAFYALTRVNRRYHQFRYGYVVDFADIQREFDQANADYYAELTRELGDEVEHYSNLFKTEAGIRADIETIREALFDYSLDDAELFSQQVGAIQDRGKLLAIVKALAHARELHNLIRLGGYRKLAGLLDFQKLRQLHIETQNALAALNLKQQMEDAHDTSGLLNQALEDVIFKFEKIGEGELKLADELKDILRRTRETLGATQDPQDPAWIKLRAELERLFKAKKLSEVSQQEMQANIGALRDIENRARTLNSANANIAARYGGDAKLMRVHKRLLESHRLGDNQTRLHAALSGIKHDLDSAVLGSRELLGNRAFFDRGVMPIVMRNFHDSPPEPDAETRRLIQQLLVNEYLGESQGRLPFG